MKTKLEEKRVESFKKAFQEKLAKFGFGGFSGAYYHNPQTDEIAVAVGQHWHSCHVDSHDIIVAVKFKGVNLEYFAFWEFIEPWNKI